MPCDYKQYHDNWKWISKQIIKEAGDKCELCYAPNKALIYRYQYGNYPWTFNYQQNMVGKYSGKIKKVIMTVHHIDGNKKNNDKNNLIALCQWCHLRLDLDRHIKNRKQKHEQQHTNHEQ